MTTMTRLQNPKAAKVKRKRTQTKQIKQKRLIIKTKTASRTLKDNLVW